MGMIMLGTQNYKTLGGKKVSQNIKTCEFDITKVTFCALIF